MNDVKQVEGSIQNTAIITVLMQTVPLDFDEWRRELSAANCRNCDRLQETTSFPGISFPWHPGLVLIWRKNTGGAKTHRRTGKHEAGFHELILIRPNEETTSQA